MEPLEAARRLSKACAGLRFTEPVAYTYDPLDYAWDGHRQYIERFGERPKTALFVGMNPGPWGMGQTGVPFGDVETVRTWMGIEDAEVREPANVREARPVHGFSCPRGEVSGARFYGGLHDHYGSLHEAYRHLYIANYCPLLFFNARDQNLTPDKLRKADREPLFGVCDEHLAALLAHFTPQAVVGIGKFAEGRARAVVEDAGLDVEILGLLHPSPASPLANKDGGTHWRRALDEVLEAAGIARESW